jgi:hypothetical protein
MRRSERRFGRTFFCLLSGVAVAARMVERHLPSAHISGDGRGAETQESDEAEAVHAQLL